MPLRLSLSSEEKMTRPCCAEDDAKVQPMEEEWPIATNKCDGGDCYDN